MLLHEPVLLLVMPILIILLACFVREPRLLLPLAGVSGILHVVMVAAFIYPVFFEASHTIRICSGLQLDSMASAFLLLTTVVVAASLLHAWPFFLAELNTAAAPSLEHIRQFYILSSLFLLSMMSVYCCDNLGFLWISVEATTLLSAGLVYFSRTKHALEAAWKYFIICSVGIAFALLGTILIFASSQHGAGEGTLSFTALVESASSLNVQLFKLGFVFVFLGYGTKAGIFPLHSWLPDAHSESPSPASAMLSGGLLNCALFAIFRFFQIAQSTHHYAIVRDFVVWMGVITTVAASIFLVRQHGLKRLWAYSSIENVGLMLVAIGLNAPLLFFLQALNHSLAKVSLFLLSGNVVQAIGSKSLKDISGIMSCFPCWGVLFAFSAFAVTGAPPFGSFISEWFILSKCLELHEIIPAGLLIVALALSFIAVSAHLFGVLFGSPKKNLSVRAGLLSSAVPLTLVVATLLLGILTNPVVLAGVFQ